MKIIHISILIIFFSSCKHDLTTKEIIDKSQRIRTELLNSKSLPSTIQKANAGSNSSSTEPSLYFYNTTRSENNLVDSIQMIATVFVDSLEHLSFHEMHLKNGNEDKSYIYKVNKYGVIDWAYFTNAPTSAPKVINDGKTTSITTSNHPNVEINIDSANYDSIHNPIKNPDKKTIAIYNDRLKSSLNELYKILFEK